MKLNNQSIREEAAAWKAAGYDLPAFCRKTVTEYTHDHPCWIHFGAGNIFRAFHANIAQRMLNAGDMDNGIIVAEGFDYEIVEKVNRPCDDLTILATLKVNGTVEKTIVGSVVESCILDSDNNAEFGRLKDIFTKDSFQMATFTIT